MELKMRNRILGAALLALTTLSGSLQIVPANADDVSYTVRFGAGSSGARYSGRIEGYDEAKYVLEARRGQKITVNLRTRNPQAYFNVSALGSDTALFVGSTSGNSYSDILSRDGKYVIQVYLMRAAARRNEAADYRLSVSISGGRPEVTPGGDFADGDAGGPDNWIVSGVASNDQLNVRVSPSAQARTITRIRNGTVVRNLGCRTRGTSRWCRVSVGVDSGVRGWVNGKFLREY
jgi:Bacterial SH3 domain